MNPWTVTIVALVAIGVLGVVGIALAQSALPAPRVNFDEASVPNTTPVVVALTNDLPSKLDIVIRRRATITPHDVILVRPSALQADLIAEAVETLQATRRGSGRLPNHDASFKVEAPGAKKPPRAVEAERWVESLRSAKPLDLPGVGGVPLIMLHLFDRELANNP